MLLFLDTHVQLYHAILLCNICIASSFVSLFFCYGTRHLQYVCMYSMYVIYTCVLYHSWYLLLHSVYTCRQFLKVLKYL